MPRNDYSAVDVNLYGPQAQMGVSINGGILFWVFYTRDLMILFSYQVPLSLEKSRTSMRRTSTVPL